MKKKGTILIIDDDPDVLVTAKMILKAHFQSIEIENSPNRLETLMTNHEYDVIILDMNFKTGATSGNEGLFWLRKIKSIDPLTQVVMNTAYGDIELAVDCMKEGAADFLVKPWQKEKLFATVNNVYDLGRSKKEVNTLKHTQKVLHEEMDQHLGDILSRSTVMNEVFHTIEKVSDTDANVLILGENGTGKELVARAIHNQSARVKKSFIKVDVGAIAENLFESELFGYTKGAFTDAKEDRMGRLELAHSGTLFLDEIGNLTQSLQSKLLSVLQNREVIRLGSNRPKKIDVRLVSATNMPLYEMTEQGEFRQDLLYRINTVEIRLPPLRQRKADIALLTDHFLHMYASKYKKPTPKLGINTLKKLENYSWPGNVRELQHAAERAVIMANQKTLEPEDFLLRRRKEKPFADNQSLKVVDIEKQTISQAIDRHHGNLTKAAEELGMGRSTLYRKMKKYGI